MIDAQGGDTGGVRQTLQGRLAEILSGWDTQTRLYTLEGEGQIPRLMVERLRCVDALSDSFRLHLSCLSLDAHLDLHALLGQRVTLHTTLADGGRSSRSALILQAVQGVSDGGLARYELMLQPWTALLEFSRHSRAFQNRTLPQIIDHVFSAPAYAGHAAWTWGESDEDLREFLALGPNGGLYPYVTQYRESDLSFVQRLLAQAGIGWRIEQHADAPSGHRVVFFARSDCFPQDPTSASPLGGPGIRFHRGAAVEQQDAVQAFGATRRLTPTASAVLQWDYLNKRAVSAEAQTNDAGASADLQAQARWLQGFQPDAPWADAGHLTPAQLSHRATLRLESHEARAMTWLARSTVRTLRAGSWLSLTQSTLDLLGALGAARDLGRSGTEEFTVHTVFSLGINNLPKDLDEHVQHWLGPTDSGGDPFRDPDPEDLFTDPPEPPFMPGWNDPMTMLDGDPAAALLAISQDADLVSQAQALGYANRFQAIARRVPWRPAATAKPPAPTAPGVQTAIVCGPDGSTTPNGADELYTDALGRIQVKFHGQAAPSADPRPDNRHSGWLRVVQDWAGPGMGQQFIPRIGQEVIVSFLGNDIDRPVVTGAVYNGRDAGGNRPAWHGASPGLDADNNASALSGIKSKEFGGSGSNQLVFDDTPGQSRVQLSSTQHASALHMGHLIHQVDNRRGKHRGTGFELRSDAFGAIRGVRGILLTTYGQSLADPAGDNAAGLALLKQAVTLALTFSAAAQTHQTTRLATAIGTEKPGASVLNENAAPLKALHDAAAGMVSSTSFSDAQTDATQRSTQASADKLPHTTDPIVAITAKAGLAIVAGQDIQFASGEAISWQSGGDTHIASGENLRIHTGQSLGILAGAVKAGSGEGTAKGTAKGTGLTLIAAQGPVQMQAQAGDMQIAAKGLVNIQTANAHIDFAAAKSITLETAGGARIVIKDGGIEVSCPGTLTVKAGKKSMKGGSTVSRDMNKMPGPLPFDEDIVIRWPVGGKPIAHQRFEILRGDGSVIRGITDSAGKTGLQKSEFLEELTVRLLPDA